MLKLFLLMYLLCITTVDLYKKEIPFQFSLLCIVLIETVQLMYYQTDFVFLVLGAVIGLLLLGISIVTRGAIGRGDGVMFFVIGSAIGFTDTLTVLAGSLILSSLVAMFLLIFRHVGKNHRIPFAPFACLTYGGMMFFG